MADYVANARFPFRPLSYEYWQQAVPKELVVDYTNGDIYVCKANGDLLNVTDMISDSITNDINDILSFTIDGEEYQFDAGIAELVNELVANNNKLASLSNVIPIKADGSAPALVDWETLSIPTIPASAVDFTQAGGGVSSIEIPAASIEGDLENATISMSSITNMYTFDSTKDGLVPKPSQAQISNGSYFLNADGTWKQVSISVFNTSKNGLVPKAKTTDNENANDGTYFLNGDGTWKRINTTVELPAATNSTLGAIKVGTGLSMVESTSGSGVYDKLTLNLAAIPTANSSTLGLVKIGNTLTMSSNAAGTSTSTSNPYINLPLMLASSASLGPTSDSSPSAGGRISIPYIEVDRFGRITNAINRSVTLPAGEGGTTGDGDQNVKQNFITSDKYQASSTTEYRMLATALTASASNSPIGESYIESTTYMKGGTLYTSKFSATNISATSTLTASTATVNNNLSTKTLTVTQNATVGGTLGVDGATTLGSTLDVTGATTLSNTLDVSGNTTVGGTLGAGSTTLSSLNVTNNATIGGTLGVTGVSTLKSVSVINNATIGGTLGVTGATTLSSVNVTGASTFTTINANSIDLGANGTITCKTITLSDSPTFENNSIAISSIADRPKTVYKMVTIKAGAGSSGPWRACTSTGATSWYVISIPIAGLKATDQVTVDLVTIVNADTADAQEADYQLIKGSVYDGYVLLANKVLPTNNLTIQLAITTKETTGGISGDHLSTSSITISSYSQTQQITAFS